MGTGWIPVRHLLYLAVQLYVPKKIKAKMGANSFLGYTIIGKHMKNET